MRRIDFPPGHLLILSVHTQHLTGRAQTHFFSLSVSHRTHAHSAWLKHKVYPVWKVRVILAPISISFLDFDVGRPVRPLPLSAFLCNRLVIDPMARQLLQPHGHGAHADRHPWQPPQFLVLRRHHRDSRQPWRFAAFGSIQQQTSTPQQEEFHRCSDFPSFRKLWQVMCRVVLALGNKTQFLTNLLQQWFLVHSRKGKTIETQTLCVRWKTENISKRPLNGKLTRLFEERELLSKNCMRLRLRLRREFGKREILTLLIERTIKNLNLSDFSCIRQVDGQIRPRETKLACMETDEFQEDHASACQEIEELRSICCEETDRARQARIE